jgi:hypothetical protein
LSSSIYTALLTLNLKIDSKIIQKFQNLVISWELRQQHPIALNSQTLGVYPIAFLQNDRNGFFEIFGLTETFVRNLTQKIPAVNQDHKVASDPFNIFCVWLMYLGYRDIPSIKTREEFLLQVAKWLHYRYFTSLINYYWCHGANEKYMTATINSLSKKFDIITYGTWKKTIEARCEDLISPESIHLKTLETGMDDKAFNYVITDTQSRIRDKIKNIFAEYKAAMARGDTIGTRGATTTDMEGEKVLVHTAKTLDLMIYNLQNEIQVKRLFIDNQTVITVAKQFPNISQDMLKSALDAIVDLAKTQSDSKQLNAMKTIDGTPTYIGMNAFITQLIQKTYRYCMNAGVDIKNGALMFVKVKNVYSSSRISDPEILANKQSIAYLVDYLNVSRRETTISSLRLALIMYFIVRSFRFV